MSQNKHPQGPRWLMRAEAALRDWPKGDVVNRAPELIRGLAADLDAAFAQRDALLAVVETLVGEADQMRAGPRGNDGYSRPRDNVYRALIDAARAAITKTRGETK